MVHLSPVIDTMGRAVNYCFLDGSRLRRRRAFGALAWLVVAGMASPAAAVEITEPRWGFDGKVRPHRFNLLTVTVDNPLPVAAEVDLELRKYAGPGPVDAPVVERKVYLAPGGRKTVHFYPYISSDWGQWRLSWERQSVDLPQPRSARRGARVLLEATEILSDVKGSVRRFPAAMFPPFATACDGLQAVVLDHAPRWDEARRVAFLDWVYRGGAVFVLLGPNGRHPEFPSSMTMFNAPLETVNYGSGVIQKVSISRNQLNRDQARALWRQLPNVSTVSRALETGQQPLPVSDDEDDEDDSKLGYSYSEGGNSLTSQSFLEELKYMTKPVHNWLLLHFMFWVYILLIFPGCFLVGQKRNDFRVVYLCLGGIVLVFSLAFGIVGQRGYGEATTVNSVAVVQPLPDGFLDVAQWSNAFVTSGAMYDIRHKGTGTLYSTCQETEAVNGSIQNGGDALFKVDIPPFSAREFAHRVKVPGKLPAVRVVKVSADETGLQNLTLSVDPAFPKTDDMYVLYRDRFYSVARRGTEISYRSNVGAAPAFLRIEQNAGFVSSLGRMGDDRTPQSRYRDLFLPLATRSLNIRSLADAQAVRWNPDRVRLMYYADLLPELAVDSRYFPNQKGKALYCIDLPFSEVPAP